MDDLQRFFYTSPMVTTPTAAPPAVAVDSDPLGQILHLLRLTGTLYCRSELTAPWAIDMPPIEACMMFHVLIEGRAELVIDASVVELRRGSVTLVPHGRGHLMRSDEKAPVEGLFEISVEKVSDRYEVMRYGGGGASTRLLCGVMRFDHAAARQLIDALPPVIHVDAWEEDEGSWLQSTVRLLGREARELRPGGETVITRLADIVVVQMLRAWLESAPQATTGWLGALHHPQIGRAMACLHRDPARGWTVESLAQEVGMSRSAFAAHFREFVGESAMRYLTRWRLELARMELAEGHRTALAEIAEKVGYRSEPAFCRAFKREFGVSPGRVRSQA